VSLSPPYVVGFPMWHYARLSDDENEQTRLFLVGIKAGREFLDAVNKGQITDEAKEM
jgi:hypothetical protein